MRYSLNFVKYCFVMMCIFSNSYLFAASCCNPPQQGPAGPQGPQGPSFIQSYGAWYIPGPDTITIGLGDVVPFSIAEATSGITNNAGSFLLSNTGVYRITFAVLAETDSLAPATFFDLVQNNAVVSGGEINGNLFGLNPVTVTISANAGDIIQVRFVGPDSSVEIGANGESLPPGPNSTYAYITFLQIQ